jgi:hypothetical protein
MSFPSKALSAILLAIHALTFAQIPGAALPPGDGGARTKALAAIAEADPELSSHFGLFKIRPAATGSSDAKLVVAANIVSSVGGKRVSPEALGEIAAREKLYTEDAYGANSVLGATSLCRLMSLAMGGRYSISLEQRIVDRIPSEEAQDAEASSDLFVILVYIDRVPMIESRLAWGPDGRILRVSVVNPQLGSVGAVPYKARSEYDPEAFDVWEFYRFRKAAR